MTLVIKQTQDLARCHALRREVFIEEQGVSEAEELDDKDASALHYLAISGDIAVGTARVLIAGTTAKIGRVCVRASNRGQGVGAQIMQVVLQDMAARGDLTNARLGAQLTAITFYERLGFVAQGPVFLDAGIKHRDMVCPLE